MSWFKIIISLFIPGGLRDLAQEINELTEGGDLA